MLAYFAAVNPGSGELRRLEMVPFRIRRFRLERPARPDTEWLRGRLGRECRKLGTSVGSGSDGAFTLEFS